MVQREAAAQDAEEANREASEEAVIYVLLQAQKFDGWLELLAGQVTKLRNLLG